MSPLQTRACPACRARQVTLIQRGYAGKTDAADQYFICQHCGQTTMEIVSVSQRDLRLHRYEVGGTYHHENVIYAIQRILKVGFDEILLYVRATAIDLNVSTGARARDEGPASEPSEE